MQGCEYSFESYLKTCLVLFRIKCKLFSFLNIDLSIPKQIKHLVFHIWGRNVSACGTTDIILLAYWNNTSSINFWISIGLTLSIIEAMLRYFTNAFCYVFIIPQLISKIILMWGILTTSFWYSCSSNIDRTLLYGMLGIFWRYYKNSLQTSFQLRSIKSDEAWRIALWISSRLKSFKFSYSRKKLY